MFHPYVQGTFWPKFQCPPTYKSFVKPSTLARLFPSLLFYSKLLFGPFLWLCHKAHKGQCEDTAWAYGSTWFAWQIEQLGCPIHVEGLDVLQKTTAPVVFVANHMSTLETFVLPSIIRPYKPVTFVVKESLVRLPLFGAVMRSRNPIVVKRQNPREDLSIVLNEGIKRLQEGISVIVFPQSTRTNTFSPEHFNTIGEKLAKKAQVPVVPLALKTDCWPAGRWIKEIGPIHLERTVHFRFGEPRMVEGNGKQCHADIIQFIQDALQSWSKEKIQP